MAAFRPQCGERGRSAATSSASPSVVRNSGIREKVGLRERKGVTRGCLRRGGGREGDGQRQRQRRDGLCHDPNMAFDSGQEYNLP